jgi:Prokaryotic E2 family E
MNETEVLLPEADVEFLVEKEYEFELIAYNGTTHVILKNVSFSGNYKPRNADILIIVPAGYPNAQLDMFWVCPEIYFKNGSAPDRTGHRESFHGRTWQRWSRHGSWRGGIDNLRTFISSIRKEIDSE